MREIKFRAWYRYNNILLYNIQNAYDCLIGRLQDVYGFDVEYFEQCFDDFLNNDEYVVEQYTGLKDKNGVEIYEGDIVAEITQFDDDEPDLYEVVYNEDGHYPAFDLKGWTGEVNGISELSLTYGIEVIGNIHENADLLEDD